MMESSDFLHAIVGLEVVHSELGDHEARLGQTCSRRHNLARWNQLGSHRQLSDTPSHIMHVMRDGQGAGNT